MTCGVAQFGLCCSTSGAYDNLVARGQGLCSPRGDSESSRARAAARAGGASALGKKRRPGIANILAHEQFLYLSCLPWRKLLACLSVCKSKSTWHFRDRCSLLFHARFDTVPWNGEKYVVKMGFSFLQEDVPSLCIRGCWTVAFPRKDEKCRKSHSRVLVETPLSESGISSQF